MIKTFRMTNKSFSKEAFGKKKIPRVKIDLYAANYNGVYDP